MIKTAFFFGIIGLWVFYVYIGSTPSTRTYRACYPLYVSVFELPNEVISRWDYSASVKWGQWGVTAFNGCQYYVYKSVYGERQPFTQESGILSNH